MKDMLNISYIEHIFLLETNLHIRARLPKGSLDFSYFTVFLRSVKNIKERAVHIIPETVITYIIRYSKIKYASCGTIYTIKYNKIKYIL
jgi:hypothetical protein